MNKSAVLWFEFLSKRFGPGPSSVELEGTRTTRRNFCPLFLLNIPLLSKARRNFFPFFYFRYLQLFEEKVPWGFQQLSW